MIALITAIARSAEKPVQWEHGWKTSYVVATRYENRVVGFNVGFAFPKNPYDCDSAELFQFLEANGWQSYQGGGYPGAPIYTVNKAVKSREDADKLLPKFLPLLDDWVRKNLR